MMRVAVEFAPSGRVAWVPAGVTVSAAARAAGVDLPSSCGGKAVCGLCAVRVLSGQLAPPEHDEEEALRRGRRGVRLACRARVSGPVTVSPIVRPASINDSAHADAERGGYVFSGDISTGGRTVAAVDLGTTSISVVVLDSSTGKEMGRATVPNGQREFGADVLSRLSAAMQGEGDALRAAAEASVLEALDSACRACSFDRMVIAGNTAMGALLTGADPSPLTAAPFSAPDYPDLPADSPLRKRMTPDGRIDVVEPVAAFVGGDVLSGISLLVSSAPQGSACLVDIGTNAEVAVLHEGLLTVASAPAGPAFDGWGVSCGGPAVSGAVERVEIVEGDVRLATIGAVKPRWFSGSGLVSAMAQLRRHGHMSVDGLLLPDGPLSGRFERDEAGVLGVDFGGVNAAGDGDSGSLRLTQLDVRTLQLAKAAVRVAVEAALRASGVAAAELAQAWIAGAFGQALEPGDLIELGFVPSGALHALSFPGNTSLAGAIASALDENALQEVGQVTKNVRAIDLVRQEGFGDLLLSALALEPYDV